MMPIQIVKPMAKGACGAFNSTAVIKTVRVRNAVTMISISKACPTELPAGTEKYPFACPFAT